MAFGDLVQFALASSGGNVILGSAPTLGNTLVYVFNGRTNPSTNLTPSPGTWALVDSALGGAGNSSIGMRYKPVELGDTGTWSSGTGTSDRCMVLEFEGSLTRASHLGRIVAANFDGTDTLTPAAGLPTLMLSAIGANFAFGGSPLYTADPVSGMTLVYGGSTLQGPPSMGVNRRFVSSPSGSYSVGSTGYANPFETTQLVAAAFTGTPPPPALGIILDIGGTILDTAVKKSIRVDLDGTGVGQFEINRYDANATPAVLAPGALVKVTIPRIDPNPIFSFFVENSGIKLVSADEHGGENIRITGNGGLSYLDRAIWLAQSFIVNWWPATMATPPGGTKGALIVKPGTYRHYTIAGGVITGSANFTTAAGFSAYFDSRKTYDWPSANSKRFLAHLSTTEDPASPDYTGYYFHPHQDGVTEYLPSYALNSTILLTSIGSGDKPGQVLYRIYQEAVNASRPIHPVPALTVDFTDTLDSAGNAWTTTNALVGVTADLGETYLTTIGKLLGTGVLDIVMGPDLVMHAYNHYGRDLTGAAFGTGVVRFVKGVNIADELSRELNPQPVPTWTEVIGTNDITAQQALTASTPPREISIRGQTDDTTALAALGLAELNRQRVQVDSVGFRVTAIGDDATTGTYLPGPPGSAHGKYWIGDLVRLHTGTGGQDLNEANERVAAITIAEDEAANLEVTVELGSALGGGNGLLATAGSTQLAGMAATVATTTIVEGSLSNTEVAAIADAEVAAKAGAASPITIRYTFSSTTTDADPGGGFLRLSNSTQYLAVTARADLADAEGADVTALLDAIGLTGGTIRGYLRIQKRDDPTKWLVGSVSAIASPSGYRNITIANIAKSANSPFVNGDLLTLTFVPSLALGSATPVVDSGSGTAGSAGAASKEDHVHPAAGGSGTLTTVEEVDGSPTDSAVTKIVFPNGTLAIASHVATYTPTGGSGAKYPFDTNFFDETKPGSPNATYDDEMDDTTGMSGSVNGLAAKWAWRNQGGASVTFGKQGWLTLNCPSQAGNNFRIIEVSALADGTYDALVSFEYRVLNGGSTTVGGGMVLVDGTNGDFYFFGHVRDTGTEYVPIVQRWTNVTTFGANDVLVGVGFASPNHQFLRVVKAGTALQFWVSDDGIGWAKVLDATDAIGATRIGFAVNENVSTGLTKLHVDYLRKVA